MTGQMLAHEMETRWEPFRALVTRLDGALERVTPVGWTAKEMLAHVAFWDETVEAVIVGMYRGQLRADWSFGSGYAHADDGWPPAEVHNAREAAWARDRTVEEVLGRLDRAHARALEVVRSITADEIERDDRFPKFVELKGAHYDEHRPELEALLS